MQKSLRLVVGAMLGSFACLVVLLGASHLLAAPDAPATVPSTMHYQGYLIDSSGDPITGTIAVEAKIYDASTDGTLHWQEVQTDVSVSGGHFNLLLGANTPLTPSVFSGSSRYLQIGVNLDNDGNGPFSTLPRQVLAAVPYALHAERSGQAEHAGSAAGVPWSGVTGKPGGLDDGDDDTLAGLSCSDDQIARWDGSAWVCADRYYTESELNTSGGGGQVHWDNLTSVPAGFADGVDNDTTYSAGDGLALDGAQFRVATLPMGGFVDRTLDSTGTTGQHPAIIIGLDGLPLISYYDASSGDLEVYHCDDLTCASGTRTTVDSDGVVGEYSSITIGRDGYGLISYYDRTNSNLKLAHCQNTACTSADLTTVDSTGDVGQWTSITTDENGYAFISYYDAGNADLKAVACSNLSCTSKEEPWILDSAGNVGQYTAVARNAREYAYISYYDATNGNLKVACCVNMDCDNLVVNTVDGTDTVNEEEEDVGLWTSIAIAMDSYPLIAYAKAAQDGSTSQALVAHCTNSQCSAATVDTIISMGSSGSQFQGFSITAAPSGQGLISFTWDTATRVYYAQCTDLDCTNTMINDSVVSSGRPRHTSLTIGADGLPVFVYYNDVISDNYGDLRLVHCSDLTCQPYLRRR